jgi:hypothetical protein
MVTLFMANASCLMDLLRRLRLNRKQKEQDHEA